MTSNKILSNAEYKIALMQNNVTDEIRNNFYNLLEETSIESYFRLFEFILNSTLTHLRNNILTSDEAINFFQQEYINTPLEDNIIDYEQIKDFIENLIFDYSNKEKFNNKEELINKYLFLTEDLPLDIYLSIRYTLLNYLINGLPFDQNNINLAQKIIDEIKTIPLEERVNKEVLTGVLEQIFTT